MRILVLQESDWIERGPQQSHHLLERMAQRGHEIRVIDFEIGWRDRSTRERIAPRRVVADVHKVCDDASVTVVRPAFIRVRVLDYLSSAISHSLEIRRQIRELRPDVVVGLGILNGFAGIRLTRRRRIPFVYYLIDTLHRLVPEPAFRGLSKVLEESNLRRSSLVLSINQNLHDYALAMGAQEGRSKVLPAGVDLTRYNSADRRRIRSELGLAEDDLVLFFMGWMYPFSGLLEVAHAILGGGPSTKSLKLLVVGKGPVWDGLQALRKDSESRDRIVALEWLPYDQIPAYLGASDICLLAAQRDKVMQDIVPIKMYEYLAAAKPVLATRLPGLVREFGEGHGVVYVDGPEQVVARALELAHEGQLPELGAQARAFVSGNDWQTIADTFESYLRGLVEECDVGTDPPSPRR